MTLQQLSETVVKKLILTHQVLCTVESCTGGLIANQLTNIAGASAVYWGSWVVYDNLAKEALGVNPETIEKHGAVSKEVAHQLAEAGLNQAKKHFKISPPPLICVTTTGIAGPSGGSTQKPVGLCFIGLAVLGQKTIVEELRVDPRLDRIEIKSLFATRALELIIEKG